MRLTTISVQYENMLHKLREEVTGTRQTCNHVKIIGDVDSVVLFEQVQRQLLLSWK